ncbi:MAG: hypothetical protein HYV96_12095 [Opitutae bacterium]|nr:hypothetical protein [Opitutae bacterium]
MRCPLLFCGVLALLAPAADGRELLRELLHPKSDLPAFRCTIPADWTSEIDRLGNLQLASDARTATFSLGIVHSADPHEALDGLAKTILADAIAPPWKAREPAEISGHRGYKYTARVRAANGVEIDAEVILVAVGDKHIASCSMLLSRRISRDDEVLARLVFGNVKLLPSR